MINEDIEVGDFVFTYIGAGAGGCWDGKDSDYLHPAFGVVSNIQNLKVLGVYYKVIMKSKDLNKIVSEFIKDVSQNKSIPQV